MVKRALIWAAVSTRPQSDEDEKFSIPKQINDGEAMCDREGWQIVDVLKVPGHSRDYRTLDQLAADARKRNIDAFDRLIEHFNRRDFDIFICRDANRFARKASLLHYIAETIIEDCGALIYSQNDNMFVDEKTLPMWATLQGYKVRAEMKWLLDLHDEGMTKRAQRGLPTSSRGTLLSHKIVDVDGTEQIVPDESKRRLLEDATLLLLEGVPFNLLEERLFALGHVKADGKPYSRCYMRLVVFHPTFWGNSARHWNNAKDGFLRGLWSFDPSVVAPEGVEIYYHTHDPFLTGELSERLQAELRYRVGLRGNSRPQTPKKLSGIFICAECGYRMAYVTTANDPRASLRCKSRYSSGSGCNQRRGMRECDAIAWLTPRLDQYLKTYDLSVFTDAASPSVHWGNRIEEIKTELQVATGKMRNAIDLQTEAPRDAKEARDYYAEKIKGYSAQIAGLNQALAQAEQQKHKTGLTYPQLKAIEDIKKVGLPAFWDLPSEQINRTMKAILDGNVLKIEAGKITQLRMFLS